MDLFALLIWRCWVYTAWLGFRRTPRVRSAKYVQLALLAVDPFGWLGHTASFRHILLFTLTCGEAMNHTWSASS
jgi:hypothetical protein